VSNVTTRGDNASQCGIVMMTLL